MKSARFPLWLALILITLGLLFVLLQGWFAYGNAQTYPPGFPAGKLAGDLLVNFLLMSIPLGLLFGGAALLLVAWQQRRNQGRIDPGILKWLYWLPRLAGIPIILFAGLYSLGLFGPALSTDELLAGFVRLNLPVCGLLIILALAWRWEWLGFWIFMGGAFLFLGVFPSAGNLLLFVGPLLAIAVLYGANWQWRDELHPEATSAA